jgi:hypothetical protein
MDSPWIYPGNQALVENPSLMVDISQFQPSKSNQALFPGFSHGN